MKEVEISSDKTIVNFPSDKEDPSRLPPTSTSRTRKVTLFEKFEINPSLNIYDPFIPVEVHGLESFGGDYTFMGNLKLDPFRSKVFEKVILKNGKNEIATEASLVFKSNHNQHDNYKSIEFLISQFIYYSDKKDNYIYLSPGTDIEFSESFTRQVFLDMQNLLPQKILIPFEENNETYITRKSEKSGIACQIFRKELVEN